MAPPLGVGPFSSPLPPRAGPCWGASCLLGSHRCWAGHSGAQGRLLPPPCRLALHPSCRLHFTRWWDPRSPLLPEGPPPREGVWRFKGSRCILTRVPSWPPSGSRVVCVPTGPGADLLMLFPHVSQGSRKHLAQGLLSPAHDPLRSASPPPLPPEWPWSTVSVAVGRVWPCRAPSPDALLVPSCRLCVCSRPPVGPFPMACEGYLGAPSPVCVRSVTCLWGNLFSTSSVFQIYLLMSFT